ncbi:putative tail fiber protein [Pseudomonas phage PaBG]|nr:putative tail fiber protein [Pseudomonas phage PaBG]QKE11219.1 putative tail fiber protein [Pseudomonas phage PaBG]
MSRLRIRDAKNVKWIDICQSEWRVRNPANTGWIRITPAQGIKARHGSEYYWLDIDCLAEEGTEDCGQDEYGGTPDGKGENGTGPGKPSTGGGDGSGGGGDGGGGDGGGNGGDNGSNNGGSGDGGGIDNGPDSPSFNDGDSGSGNGGSGWQEDAPYPPGFDLPDSDGDGAGDKGDCIYRPGLNTCETKQPIVVRPDMDCGTKRPGSWDCPFECPDSVSGSGAGISEFYINMGTASGNIKFPWIASAGASFDIYYRGKRVATTSGQRKGTGALTFVFNPVNNDPMLFVRVRSTYKTNTWTLQIKCVGDDDDDGTINNPRPCHGTFEVKKEGGQGTYEFYHNLGPTAGLTDIHYQMWNQPDKMEVFNHAGVLIASTGGYVAGEAHLKFQHTPGGSNMVRVRITARDPGTSWIYLITCPGEDGSEDNPRECSDTSAVKSGGAGVTDTFIDMGSTAGKVGIRYQMWQIPDKLDVYQEGTLVATTGGPVTGDHWLYFDYDPSRGQKIQVRVTGSGATSWSFLHTCPGDEDPNISVNSPSVREGAAGESPQLCWTITMDKPQSQPVTVDYATGGGNANPVAAQGRILASDQFNNPFIAVVDQANFGKVAFDGGFPKFYNSTYVAPQPPPTGAQVFNTWWRTAGAEFYTSPSGIPSGSEANAWAYSAGSGNISSTVNSANIISFISPTAYDSYTFEATLSSSAADDDMIGLVAAYARVGSDNYQIIASRQRGGLNAFGSNWSLALVKNNSVVKVLASNAVGGTGNWNGTRTRVRVQRDCNQINVWCSAYGSETISESTLLQADLTSEDLAVFGGAATRWGFTAQSQENATFSSIFVSGIGLPPAFTYLKNIALWSRKPGNSKALILCDSATVNQYNLGTAGMAFGVGMPETLRSVGFDVTMRYLPDMGNKITAADLADYGFLVVLSTDHTGVNHATGTSAAVVANWVKNGGGLFIVTDHDVFQATANALAAPYNIEFYASVDRSPVSVGQIIASHGDHPAWEGLSCKSIPAGGSEGAIRIKQVRSDYSPISGTVTFAPGETSKEVCAPIIGNDTQDGDRTINMNISNASKGNITVPTGTGTIIDDDSALCRQNPQGVVYERAGGGDGAYLMHVQPDYNCAAGNTKYLMMANLTFPYTGPYVITMTSDDDFELYIDCKKVASGPIGTRQYTVNINAGTRNVILRYLNVPNCTPGYAGFTARYNNLMVYSTRAADWKGQANSIGEIE